MKVISLAVLVLSLMVTGTAMAQTPCSAGVTTTMPEGNPEASVSVSCPGFTFASAETAVFFDPNSLVPSDIVTLTNVNGVATITFVSDTEIALGLPGVNFITVDEPNPFVAIAISSTGGIGNSKLTFTSDADTGTSSTCGANSDCVTASTTPEPGTLVLLGTGIFGFAGLIRRRLAS